MATAPLGVFDQAAYPLGWFDSSAQADGWFDRGLIGPVIPSPTYWPLPAEVLAGVSYGPTGVDYLGTYVDSGPGGGSGGGASVGAILRDLGSNLDYVVTTSRTIERL